MKQFNGEIKQIREELRSLLTRQNEVKDGLCEANPELRNLVEQLPILRNRLDALIKTIKPRLENTSSHVVKKYRKIKELQAQLAEMTYYCKHVEEMNELPSSANSILFSNGESGDDRNEKSIEEQLNQLNEKIGVVTVELEQAKVDTKLDPVLTNKVLELGSLLAQFAIIKARIKVLKSQLGILAIEKNLTTIQRQVRRLGRSEAAPTSLVGTRSQGSQDLIQNEVQSTTRREFIRQVGTGILALAFLGVVGGASISHANGCAQPDGCDAPYDDDAGCGGGNKDEGCHPPDSSSDTDENCGETFGDMDEGCGDCSGSDSHDQDDNCGEPLLEDGTDRDDNCGDSHYVCHDHDQGCGNLDDADEGCGNLWTWPDPDNSC